MSHETWVLLGLFALVYICWGIKTRLEAIHKTLEDINWKANDITQKLD